MEYLLELILQFVPGIWICILKKFCGGNKRFKNVDFWSLCKESTAFYVFVSMCGFVFDSIVSQTIAVRYIFWGGIIILCSLGLYVLYSVSPYFPQFITMKKSIPKEGCPKFLRWVINCEYWLMNNFIYVIAVLECFYRLNAKNS